MKNIEIKFYEATVFSNKIMNFSIVDYSVTINNLDIHIVVDVDDNGELTGNIRFYSCNYYSIYFESDDYLLEQELFSQYFISRHSTVESLKEKYGKTEEEKREDELYLV